MNRYRGLIVTAAAALVLLIALLVAGSGKVAVRTFALDEPNSAPVAQLHPSAQSCQGPVSSEGPATAVGIWGAAAAGTARLTIDVQDARTRRVLASGPVAATTGNGQYTAHLGRTIPGGRPVRICLTENSGVFVLYGGGPARPDVVMTGGVGNAEFSLVLLQDRSLIGSLPMAFSRASLWRPSWVGSWTFWVLLMLVVAAFGLVVAAVGSAAADDEPEGRRGSGDDVPPPSPGGRSEPSQDRPQALA